MSNRGRGGLLIRLRDLPTEPMRPRSALSVTVTPESRSLTGRWRQDEDVVLTVVSEDPAAQLRASWVADTLRA